MLKFMKLVSLNVIIIFKITIYDWLRKVCDALITLHGYWGFTFQLNKTGSCDIDICIIILFVSPVHKNRILCEAKLIQ